MARVSKKRTIEVVSEEESNDEETFPQVDLNFASLPKPKARKEKLPPSEELETVCKDLFPILPTDVEWFLSINGSETIVSEDPILRYKKFGQSGSKNKTGTWQECDHVIRWILGSDPSTALLEGANADEDTDLQTQAIDRVLDKVAGSEEPEKRPTHYLDGLATRIVELLVLNRKTQNLKDYALALFGTQMVKRGFHLLTVKYPAWKFCLEALSNFKQEELERDPILSTKYTPAQREYVTFVRLDNDLQQADSKSDAWKSIQKFKEQLAEKLQDTMVTVAMQQIKKKKKAAPPKPKRRKLIAVSPAPSPPPTPGLDEPIETESK